MLSAWIVSSFIKLSRKVGGGGTFLFPGILGLGEMKVGIVTKTELLKLALHSGTFYRPIVSLLSCPKTIISFHHLLLELQRYCISQCPPPPQ